MVQIADRDGGPGAAGAGAGAGVAGAGGTSAVDGGGAHVAAGVEPGVTAGTARSTWPEPLDVPPPTPWVRVAGLAAALALLVVTMLTAFVWPAVSGTPHDIPFGVAAPPEAATGIEAALDQAQPGAFTVTRYADADSARTAVAHRDVYGALVLGPDGATMLTAPAGSPAVATALGQVADALGARLAQEQGVEVPRLVQVEPVVALPADDPRGAGLAAAALPLVLASVASGVVGAVAVRGIGRRVALVCAVAVVGGLAAVGVAGPWLGVLTGGYWAQAGVVALGVGAVGLAVVGAHALLGRPGLAVVVATMVLLGNPLSAAASAPELLPDGWGSLGQALPPGAVVSALRSVAYFDGSGAAAPLLVLTAWVCAGLVLVGAALGWRRLTSPDR